MSKTKNINHLCRESVEKDYILRDFKIKTQHLDNSFNLCLEKEGRTIILIVC